MCGRYSLVKEYEKFKRQFPLLAEDFYQKYVLDRPEIFPGTNILAINNRWEPEEDWWTIRDKSWDGKMVSTVNAKAENITRTPMFRDAFKSDRVLIPATSLFEWQVQDDGSKKKFKIWFDEPLFAFAGVARECEIKGEPKRCAVIVTTAPNETFKLIHNTKMRQAVVIRENDYEKWLNPKTSSDELKELMKPLPEAETHFEEADEKKAEQPDLFS
ncbi:SOS response-associated peptidase [soil metagenome]